MNIKSPEEIGKIVREVRKSQHLTQIKLAKLCNIGTRFVGDLENGKPTCQLDKTITVLCGLGIKINLSVPETFMGYGGGSGDGAGFGDGTGYGGGSALGFRFDNGSGP